MSINWWTYPYSEILLDSKKEGSPDAGYSMEEPQKHCAKLNKLVTKDHVCIVHLNEIAEVGTSLETECSSF